MRNKIKSFSYTNLLAEKVQPLAQEINKKDVSLTYVCASLSSTETDLIETTRAIGFFL